MNKYAHPLVGLLTLTVFSLTIDFNKELPKNRHPTSTSTLSFSKAPENRKQLEVENSKTPLTPTLKLRKFKDTIKIEGKSYRVKWLYREDFSDDTWRNKWVGEGEGAQFKVVNQQLHITDSIGATFWHLAELPANLVVRYKVCADDKQKGNKVNFNHFSHARENKDAILVVGKKSNRKGPYREYHTFPNYIATFTPQHSRLRKDPGFNLLSNSAEKSVAGRVYEVLYIVNKGRLRYYLNGVPVHYTTDQEPLSGGKFGIRTWSTSAWWDDIEIGEILL